MDTLPKIFDYIRLMQEYTPCIDEWQYQDNNGKWITAPFDECLKRNQEDGAEWSKVSVFRNDLKQLVEVNEYQLPDVRLSKIEVNVDGIEKIRIEKMFKRIINDDENGLEIYNSLALLYNLLTPEVQEYLDKRKIIAGTGYSVGGYDNLTDYYKDVSQCKNLIKNGCLRIVVSVVDGTIANIKLTGRNGKDVIDVPLLDKRTNVKCRSTLHEYFMSLIENRLPEQNYSLQLLNHYVDPCDKWIDVKKMSFMYESDSDYLYTFDEVRSNIAEYLEAISKHEIQERNKFTQGICQRLECLYRYLRNEIKMPKTDSWEFICDLWKFPEDKDDVRMAIMRYIGNYQKELPIQFVVKQ